MTFSLFYNIKNIGDKNMSWQKGLETLKKQNSLIRKKFEQKKNQFRKIKKKFKTFKPALKTLIDNIIKKIETLKLDPFTYRKLKQETITEKMKERIKEKINTDETEKKSKKIKELELINKEHKKLIFIQNILMLLQNNRKISNNMFIKLQNLSKTKINENQELDTEIENFFDVYGSCIKSKIRDTDRIEIEDVNTESDTSDFEISSDVDISRDEDLNSDEKTDKIFANTLK